MIYIQDDAIVYKVYSVNKIARTTTLEMNVQAGELVNSTITQSIEDGGTLEVEVKSLDKWKQIKELIKTKPVYMERIVNGSAVNAYWLNDPSLEITVEDGTIKSVCKLYGADFVAWYMARKQVENNFYIDTLPAEGTGDAHKFNKFDTSNKKLYYHIEDIFSNMLSNADLSIVGGLGIPMPRDRQKGTLAVGTGQDLSREVAEFGVLDYSNLGNSANNIYVRLKKGRSMQNMMLYIFNAFYKKGEDFAGHQRAVRNAGTSRVDFTMYKPTTLIIDALTYYDKITRYTYQYLNSAYVNDVLVESDQEIDFYYNRQQIIDNKTSTSFELHEESAPDDDPNAASLQTTALNILAENEIAEAVTFDIDLSNFNFWQDINEGDKLQFQDFDNIFEELNGTYKLYSFSEIIEGVNIEYTIDDMRKEN